MGQGQVRIMPSESGDARIHSESNSQSSKPHVPWPEQPLGQAAEAEPRSASERTIFIMVSALDVVALG